MDRTKQTVQQGIPVTSLDAAHANQYFEQFVNATSLKNILGYYRGLIDNLHLKPNYFTLFYPKLKANLTSWRAKALLKKFDSRASHKCYQKGKLASNTRVLVIGGGPCGLRTAIEAQLLGAKVVVVEKRDRFSRNNVLHLWPFVIEDLRMLGAKKFFGKFCAGAIDHISIRQLQCILMKVALLLGVEIHTEVSFEELIEPNAAEKIGWRAQFKPSNHPVSQYEFDVIIGADGKRNTLQGFTRKEFRGKLAIAITANFINKKTEAEARVEEISGVAFIFNQKFFKDLQESTRIDLENIVYYKDDTHYFVMTAKKHSLIEKGVIKQDFPDTERLLASENVDKDALQKYAIEAASFSTNYQMPNLEFAVNHYGQPDIAMFDFTSMYVAENASKVVERSGYRLLKILVGDSLLEPFWPTGSGCARGFLSALDAAWAIRSWSLGTVSPLDVLAERESIYRLLAQTTPDNLNKDWKSYTLDPSTRYPNLNKAFVLPHQVISLYDTDNPASIERMKRSSTERTNEVPKKRRRGIVDNEVLLNWLVEQLKDKEEVDFTDIGSVFKSGKVLCAIIHRYRPDLLDFSAIKNNDAGKNNQIAIDILEKDLGILPVMTGTELTVTEDYLTMASYLTEIYDCFRGEIPYIKHPKLELPLGSTKLTEVSYKTIKSAGMPSPSVQVSVHSNRNKHKHNDSHAQRLSNIDKKPKKRRSMEKIGDHENKPSQVSRTSGRDEDIAAKIKHLENKWRQPEQVDKKPKDLMRAIGKIETTDWNIKEIEKKILENKLGKPSKPNDREKVPKWSKEQFVARQSKMEKQHIDRQNSAEAKFAEIDRSIKNLDQKIKEGTVRELGQNKVASITEKLVGKIQTEPKPVEKNITRQPLAALPTQNASEFCHFCNKRVYLMERLSAEGRFFHHSCFKCQYCHVQLRLGSYTFDRDGLYGHRFFCLQHFGMLGESPSARVVRKHSIKRQNDLRKSPEKKPLPGIAGVDLLDKVQTPERIEFANLSTGNISSDQEDSLNQIDEDEWTDKNFGASCAELDDTDDDSSSISYSDSEDEDAYDDALEEPATKEGTLKWAERWKNSYSKRKNNSDSNEYSSSDQSSYYDSSDGDESETATEGEEEIRARELRKQEVCVEPPIVHTDTGTDTEIVSDETSSGSSSEVHNSATEISTDSEFAQDDPTPTREIPSILLNDFNVTKTRGSGGNYPKKIQVTSRYLQRPSNGKTKKPNIDLKLTPLVPSALSVKKTAPATLSRSTGYVLNRTQSTGGIAAKVSLELKKKYLLGEPNPGSIQKSGSASTLDTKFKSFHTNISDCQKLLKPSTEISASMQTFCKKLNELQSPAQSFPTIFTKDNAPTESTNTKEIQNISVEEQHTNDVKPEKVFENESEGRPRSPLHETSIIVPQIDWNKQNNILTSDSLASSESDNEADKKRKQFENKPRVEICTEYLNEHTQEDKDQFVPDSLVCVNKETVEISSNDPPKSITSEKKTLNQPKSLPNLENLLPEIHNSLHIKHKNLDNFSKELSSAKVHSSGVSSPESIAEQVTTALTETELSDWARDGVVSDDFEDEEYESNVKYTNKPVKRADLLEFDESLSKKSTEIPLKDKIVLTQAVNNVLSINLDNIEFMDTGTETSSDDGVANSQNGYVLFKNEDDFAEDSLNPHINDILETTNIHVLSLSKNNKEIPDSDVTQQTQNIVNNDLDDDSVVIIESGTTTEENTLTDLTVKNVTEFGKESPNNNKTTETETTPVNEFKLEPAENIDNSIEFQKHCERLKSKVEFSNVKDSIDIRNSRRKSKPDILYTPDLITEEVSSTTTSKNVSLNLSSAHHTPDILYNKEVIKKERDINQKLIQEMVMTKMKAENKSLERRKRNKMSPSIKSPSDLTKSATATNVLCSYKSIQNTSNKALFSSSFDQPDVLLSTNYPLQNSKSANIDFISSEITYTTPSNVDLKPTPIQKTPDNSNIPKPPPRYNKTPEEMNKKLEKLKQQVRLRNKENEHLLLNRHKFENNQRKEAALRRCVSGNYELALFSSTAAHDSYSSRAKSTPDFPNKLMAVHPSIIDKDKKIYKSDPNILESDGNKYKTKNQDREQRKSLTKLLTGLFSKKSSSSKGLFSKLSPKSKKVSKEPLIYKDRKSLSETYIARNLTPPPIPPLPVNYVKKADDSSDDDGLKKRNDSSCDTLDFTGASIGSVSVRKSTKSRRTSRQAQLKRHRMAQEIQRKLEETEVKMKELENRGVSVEKALRGEDNSYKDEPELLQEWFDLMRDRTELRRYEKELSVRAQELELEDRHARLQYELRERIEDDKPKTKEDLEVEESIINEMIKIVEKRDSLLTEIEEDRLRYSHEDRDLEEQMLAKGLRLTSIKNSPE